MKYDCCLVSIICTVYNGEKYIEDCIQSILKNSFKNFELILINDGSSDGSLEILKKYETLDNRVRVFTINNSGASRARNFGLSIAKGSYIAIIDQDDLLASNYLEYFVNLAILYDADVVYTPNVKKFNKKIAFNNIKEKHKIVSGTFAAKEMLYHKIIIAPWNKLIKKTLLDKFKIKFQEQFYNGEGFCFSIECFLNSSIVVCGNQQIYGYRIGHSNSGASVYKEKYIKSSLAAQLYLYDLIKDRDKKLKKAWYFSNWHTNCDALNVIVGNNATTKNFALYKQISSVCRSYSLRNIFAPVSLQQKTRCILFFINPYFASKIINFFRMRKFK